MASPQSGIFVEASTHHHFLEYSLKPDGDKDELGRAVGEALPGAGGLAGGARPNLVIAFGPALWTVLAPGDAPRGLGPFEPVSGADGYAVPSTQRDIWIWIHGTELDDNLDRALEVHRHLASVARLELDERGFTYHDSRDLTGFIDGTANPKGEAARAAALVPSGEPGAGGAFVLSQRWVHDLGAFRALPIAEQERIIGRTKPDSIELEGEAMPADSHVSRTDVTKDGVALKIYRRSVPFGNVTEHGLYFLAFSRDPTRFDVLLARMFGASGDGVHDRLIEFSRPLTSSNWFAPSEESLNTVFGMS
jgi:putative iron-dependent peroxidase